MVSLAHFSMRPLFSNLSAEKARTYALVLTAVGIDHQASREGSLWTIAVLPSQRKSAIRAVSLYLKENPAQSPRGHALYNLGNRTYSAWYIAAVLMLIHMFIALDADRPIFVERFGADAGEIMAGHIYRCITAMLLHADMNHLLGNLAGLIIFGGVAASLCGWGLGWLMVLAAGFAGNFATAIWYRHSHLAIGASTAVFAAVGICTILSFQMRRWNRADASSRTWRNWMPMAGGLALLGLLGTSPHADLMAHLSGYVAGLIIGSLAGLRSGRLPCQASALIQWAAALSAVAIIAASWLRGVYYNG